MSLIYYKNVFFILSFLCDNFWNLMWYPFESYVNIIQKIYISCVSHALVWMDRLDTTALLKTGVKQPCFTEWVRYRGPIPDFLPQNPSPFPKNQQHTCHLCCCGCPCAAIIAYHRTIRLLTCSLFHKKMTLWFGLVSIN